MDTLTQVATTLVASENIMILNNRVVQDSTYRDIQRAKGMKKHKTFFQLYALLQEMAGSLNKRLKRRPCVDRTVVLWTNVVGDQRKKQTDGLGKKIPLIDLLSDTDIAQSMSSAERRMVALKIQKWIKNFRFKNNRDEICFSWQQSLLSEFTRIYGIQIF